MVMCSYKNKTHDSNSVSLSKSIQTYHCRWNVMETQKKCWVWITRDGWHHKQRVSLSATEIAIYSSNSGIALRCTLMQLKLQYAPPAMGVGLVWILCLAPFLNHLHPWWPAPNFSCKLYCWINHYDHKNEDSDHQPTKFWLLNEFSMSVPKEM